MIVWIAVFVLFGLVAYEQGSLFPLVAPVVLWLLFGRKVKGDLGVAGWVFILLLAPWFAVVLLTWRG